MLRKIIKIDEALCNGCGLCVNACHEGAIIMANGKATIMRDDYCDGLGDCLPVCPTKAITFEEREADAYDEAAVKSNQLTNSKLPCGCPGNHSKVLLRDIKSHSSNYQYQPSQLQQWPIQIKLAPANAPYFEHAKLLIAADCTAYAYANFHQEFMKGKITLIGCPKLDVGDYSEKLTEILTMNDIQSIQIIRMEVPCCGGMELAVQSALIKSEKMIPWEVITISMDGQILNA